LTAAGTATANTIAQSARVKQGNENWDAIVVKAATITTLTAAVTTGTPAPAIEGFATTGVSNHYWDFM